MTRRVFAIIGILVLAAILAFPLRAAVYGAVIIPIAYFLWALGLLYHSIHESLWWSVVVLIVLYVLTRSLIPKFRFRERVLIKSKPVIGQVENLAMWIKKSRDGTYFKWLVANRLGKIALQIISLREIGKQRSVFDPLTGSDWTPEPGVQSYLEAGLQKSFADFPQGKTPFTRPAPTPLDHDLNSTLDYLEAQVKK